MVSCRRTCLPCHRFVPRNLNEKRSVHTRALRILLSCFRNLATKRTGCHIQAKGSGMFCRELISMATHAWTMPPRFGRGT